MYIHRYILVHKLMQNYITGIVKVDDVSSEYFNCHNRCVTRLNP